MPNIVLIETSQTACSVALSVDGVVEREFVEKEGMMHAVVLPREVRRLIEYCDESGIKIDGVAISAGPGSYTGLRIATSTAKGICYGRDAHLLAVDTLAVIAEAGKKKAEKNGLILEEGEEICAMIDARRMEVYTSRYDIEINRLSQAEAVVVNEKTYSKLDKVTWFCGDGAEKLHKIVSGENVRFIDGVIPLASDMNRLAIDMWQREKWEDIAYYEPLYLKDFQITTSKKQPLVK